MIFISKHNNERLHSSNKEACLSIIGLFLAIGSIGGLAGLIYGLVKDNSSATIAGATVLAVSIIFSIMFVFLIVFCLKNNNNDSNTNQHHQHRRKQNFRIKQENSSPEIKTISITQNDEPNNASRAQMFSSSTPTQSPNKTNHNFTEQTETPTSKLYTFTYLNESHSSIGSSSSRHNSYNRH
ncbi:unnamed protein product [Rotaria magnacalcarata]|uniref:Uncharacterized protein n=1 Tax=Rotaria magnacalcarata TaxID=392030 RepID=A0A816TRX0_9BILA|nr:unnamed protein product [Rotaria magnacalcarata]CAF1664959.1 unnamed protein product [Rotaria magnacalcarata]CAF2096207.1 unnamed protein product [Rotaria magnacalcarata]CAF2100032.1 unnamed protein product [Rotaria magnacalcarata]CAF2149940.1 unnamed protein product [Rotaria magnacalcarata]